MMDTRKSQRILALCALALLALVCACSLANAEQAAQTGPPNTRESAVAVYKDPNGWLMNLLREFFSDIDWETISAARDQIEKFIRKVDRIIRGDRVKMDPSRIFTSSNWFGSGGVKAGGSSSAESVQLKEMLERVACFVGYMRIMNSSQEALAELDAAKVVSQLFGSTKNSSGYLSGWFG